MIASSRPVALGAWLVLVGCTLGVYFLAEDTAASAIATTAVLLIAAFKIRLLTTHFMEVRWSAGPVRIALDVWLAVITALIVGGYWLSLAR